MNDVNKKKKEELYTNKQKNINKQFVKYFKLTRQGRKAATTTAAKLKKLYKIPKKKKQK